MVRMVDVCAGVRAPWGARQRARRGGVLLQAWALVALVALVACAAQQELPPKLYSDATGDVRRAIVEAASGRDDARLAILPLEAEGEVARAVGVLLVDELGAALAGDGGITLVERHKLRAILDEMALQQTGIVAPEDQIEIGKLTGANLLLAVRATRIGDAVRLNVRLMDVKTGTALTGLAVSVAYDEDLQRAITDRNARQNIRGSKEVMAALNQVRAGELAEAESFFEPLSKDRGERRSVGLMGLAAVAHARGQLGPAQELCEVSRRESQAPTYCWVLQGLIAHDGGDAAGARRLFTRALAAETGLLGWQRSIAANGLGLLAMAEGNTDVALAMYDEAIKLDPAHASAMSNKARILEEGGDLKTAIELYQRGVKADPGDKVLALLLRDAEIRLAFAEDRARQETIAAVAGQIVAKRGETAAPPKKASWTSTPITVTILPLQEKGAPATRLGETPFLEGTVRNSLEGLPQVELVDRQLLSKVLEELQLSASNLSDEKTALQVGRIMSAKVLLGGTLVRMGGESQLTMKLIETQTTRIVGQVNEIFGSHAKLSEVAGKVQEMLRAKLAEAFPLRAQVVAKRGKRVRLDVGARLGAGPGDVFGFLDDAGAEVGRGTVAEVRTNEAWVQVNEGNVNQGARAERRSAGR